MHSIWVKYEEKIRLIVVLFNCWMRDLTKCHLIGEEKNIHIFLVVALNLASFWNESEV